MYKRQGQGSSIQSTVRQIGSALGIAIIGTIFGLQLQHDIPHSLDNVGLPTQVQKSLETSVIDSAGSSIRVLKKSNPEALHLTKPVQNKIVTNLDHNFTNSVVKTIGIASIIMLISFVLTFGLYKRKDKVKQ